MTITLLYFGPQWQGSTSLQRLSAFKRIEGVRAIGVDNGSKVGGKGGLLRRVRWKCRIPEDVMAENVNLLRAAAINRPQIVMVDNSKVIRRSTLRKLRDLGVSKLVYYSPDDIVASHNLSFPLRWSLPEWDIVCTTKTFNIPELASLGVKVPFLVGKAFDPDLHAPMPKDEAGLDYESYDAVFVGSFEPERCASINLVAESGLSVVVYGADKGNWRKESLHPTVSLRNSVFAADYVRAWHSGKVAMCFLRKINRDRITQRTMEIAAIGRPMVAERTVEHDQHFEHGREYLGFRNNDELVSQVRSLISDEQARVSLGAAGRIRCLSSGYSSINRAEEMMRRFVQ